MITRESQIEDGLINKVDVSIAVDVLLTGFDSKFLNPSTWISLWGRSSLPSSLTKKGLVQQLFPSSEEVSQLPTE